MVPYQMFPYDTYCIVNIYEFHVILSTFWQACSFLPSQQLTNCTRFRREEKVCNRKILQPTSSCDVQLFYSKRNEESTCFIPRKLSETQIKQVIYYKSHQANSVEACIHPIKDHYLHPTIQLFKLAVMYLDKEKYRKNNPIAEIVVSR